jgi:hypothetical protein
MGLLWTYVSFIKGTTSSNDPAARACVLLPPARGASARVVESGPIAELA